MVLAHFLYAGDVEAIAFQRKNEPIESRQIQSPLTHAIPLERMAPQAGQSRELVETLHGLYDIHTLDVLAGHIDTVRPLRLAPVLVLTEQLPGTESDFQRTRPCRESFYPWGKI